MEKIIYKTQPPLLILGITFLGFIFGSELFLLTFTSASNDFNPLVTILMTIFVILSLTCLFYFLTLKTIKLTKNSVVISHFLLPFAKTLNFNEILKMEQKRKDIKAMIGDSFKSKYIFTEVTTFIYLINDQPIKLTSIGENEFDEFYKTFSKLKRGEGKIKNQKRHLLIYLIDNLDALPWIILLLCCTIGLGYGIYAS